MSLFCLVHGSTQDARCWNLLAPELEKHGHTVLRVTLPTDDPLADTNRYAEAILSCLPGDAGNAIVVGHSASGYFLPVVASQRKLRRAVFLAASVPQVGSSFIDQLRVDPTMFQRDWIGKDPSNDDAAAMRFLFHDCPAETARWALTTRIRLPLERVASEIYPLQKWPRMRSSYIVCTEDRTLNPEWSRRIASERLGVDAIEISSGHCPYLSRPSELAQILARLAEEKE